MILEKAWAKLNGRYDKTKDSLARMILHDLTGAPTRSYSIDNTQPVNSPKNHTLWQKIKNAENKDVYYSYNYL